MFVDTSRGAGGLPDGPTLRANDSAAVSSRPATKLTRYNRSCESYVRKNDKRV